MDVRGVVQQEHVLLVVEVHLEELRRRRQRAVRRQSGKKIRVDSDSWV
jgi:hypothetical protein